MHTPKGMGRWRKDIQNINDNSLYLASLDRYRNNVNIDLFDDKELLLDLDMYSKSIELESKYSDINKDVLEEAYYLYFSLNNFLDKEETLRCIRRLNSFE